MFLDGPEWAARFQTFRSEAWRLETLPEYRVPQEVDEIVAFRSGERIDSRSYSSRYTDELKRQRREGKSKGRVHVLARPLSDYLHFEFMYYGVHAAAGDQIRIMDVTDRPNPLAEVQDFWMFDRAEVVLMHYEPDGKQISREVLEGDVARFREYQQIALDESVPFEEYVREMDL
ncbi:DUF6879 family protein [Streptomyces sp. ODS05-4]|uniref:DUF6879 family protein n=1 Tax=Streptomyces sp. ODS05-4 TaxID=2944939 RepID=UPI00210B5692|nr:DUF6879 family protein [Streptomyces sp. ODS05-4]